MPVQAAHRPAPTLRGGVAAHRPPPPLILEAQRNEKLMLARMAARAAASERARLLAAKAAMARGKRQRPASAPMRAAPSLPVASRLKIAAARDAAKKLLASGKQQRSPWGFFACQTQVGVGQSELHVSAPAVVTVSCGPDAVVSSHTRCEAADSPDVIVARPADPEERRLAFGPFAFRLSPSSEVLAWLAATALRPQFDGAHVLELGSGLGFTGLAVAKWCGCASVRLTDGDPASVTLLEKVVAQNRTAGGFGRTEVDAGLLLWGEQSPPPHTPAHAPPHAGTSVAQPPAAAALEEGKYDVVLCADCVYDRSLHLPLRATLRRFLKPGGTALVVASRREGSLRDFEEGAKGEFAVDNWGSGYDAFVMSLLGGKKCFPEVLSLRHSASSRARGRSAGRDTVHVT